MNRVRLGMRILGQPVLDEVGLRGARRTEAKHSGEGRLAVER